MKKAIVIPFNGIRNLCASSESKLAREFKEHLTKEFTLTKDASEVLCSFIIFQGL
jgi:hypothetical protein